MQFIKTGELDHFFSCYRGQNRLRDAIVIIKCALIMTFMPLKAGGSVAKINRLHHVSREVLKNN